MEKPPLNSFKNAPCLIGAFFLVFAFTACKESNRETAKWVINEEVTSNVSLAQTQAEAKTTPSPEKNESPTSANQEEVRFLSYNLKNYLSMRRGKSELPKPEKEINAVINLIAGQKPDILGVSEIGQEEDLLDLQQRLKKAGIDLPHYEHTGGRDRTRHLGLLSRYPIVATDSQSDLNYEMIGKTWTISRGILDATVDLNGTELRLLGVHLKSKREVDYADQELIRQNEARLLRDHADKILDENLDTLLLAYGDFNDTIGSKAVSIVRGRSNAKKHMPDFYFKDSRGELWTHFWDYQDTYARFDYVFFSKSLKDHLVGKKSYIVDDEQWLEASDHRALMLVLKL